MTVRPKNCCFFIELYSKEYIVVRDITSVQAKTLYRLFGKNLSENIKTFGWSVDK